MTSCSGFGQCVSKFRGPVLKLVLILGCIATILRFFVEFDTAGHELGDKSIVFNSNYSSKIHYDRNLTCQFPVLDPFHPSILQYVTHPPPITCQRLQPEFTYTDGYYLKINLTLSQHHYLGNLTYRNIIRKTEGSIVYGNWTFWADWNESVYLYDPVEVLGDYGPSSKPYRNLHSSIHIRNETITLSVIEKSKSSDQSDQPLNVLIFGIDSISKSNFIRNLPRTYSLLIDRMGSIVFNGYTKIDDNTFPNMLAVWTGRKVSIHGSELSGHFQHDHIDQYPFIWKNFSDRGYVTGMAEEQPGVLSYNMKGFKNQPVHWYLRPFGLALNDSPLRKNSSTNCVGNRAEAELVLEGISRFLKSRHTSGLPYFLTTFLWKISHDRASDIEMLDASIARFFRDLFDGGYLENTMIFAMGDHGNRFDSIRRTLIGRIEERMPYLSIYVPAWFKKKYPAQIQNMYTNAWRLSCQYDVYETMVDIVTRRYGDETRDRYKNRGKSLFNPIPKSRTCEDAHISAHFCVCQDEETLDVHNHSVVALAANVALDRINRYLTNYSEICEKLHLNDTLSAQRFKASDSVKYAMRYHWDKLLSDKNVNAVIFQMRVTFSTRPNGAIFEALVQYYESGKDELRNASCLDISRINPYGKDGNCITLIEKNLEKFCYCKRK